MSTARTARASGSSANRAYEAALSRLRASASAPSPPRASSSPRRSGRASASPPRAATAAASASASRRSGNRASASPRAGNKASADRAYEAALSRLGVPPRSPSRSPPAYLRSLSPGAAAAIRAASLERHASPPPPPRIRTANLLARSDGRASPTPGAVARIFHAANFPSVPTHRAAGNFPAVPTHRARAAPPAAAVRRRSPNSERLRRLRVHADFTRLVDESRRAGVVGRARHALARAAWALHPSTYARGRRLRELPNAPRA